MSRRALRITLALALLAGAGGVPRAEAGTQAQHGAITCIPSAVTQIRAATPTRRTLLLVNVGALTIYVGAGAPDALTAANGIPIAAAASKSFSGADGYTGAYSCITAEGNQSLRWEETH